MARSLFLALAAMLLSAPAFRAEGSPVIARIAVEAGDVIPPWSDEANDARRLDGLVYRLTNALHIRTREEFIRDELLFSVGDTLDPLAIAETEHNLRNYAFINEAVVRVVPTGAGTVEVHVRTSDNFTLAPSFSASGGGGRRAFRASLVEHSFLGRGTTIGARWERGIYDRYVLGEYREPRILGSRWSLSLQGYRRETSHVLYAELNRPYYSLRTTGAAGVRGSYARGIGRFALADGGMKEIGSRGASLGGWISRAWGRPALRRTLTFDAQWSASRSPLDAWGSWYRRTTYQAIVESRIEPFGGFVERRNMDDVGVVEGYREGGWIGLAGGIGVQRVPEAPPYGIVRANAGWTAFYGEHATAFSVSAGARIRDETGAVPRHWSNLGTSAWIHHYWQGLPGQTIALSANWRHLDRLEFPYWYGLGGDVGLRGYRVWRFSGTRRLLFNVEDRIRTPFRVLTYALGAVAFADAGYAWRPGAPVRFRDLHPSAGVGLRIHNTRASFARVSRIDVAFPLRRGRGFFLSFGAEQTFDLMNWRPTPTQG